MSDHEYSDLARILIIDDNPSIHRDFEFVLLEESANTELDADERRMYGGGGQASAARRSYFLDHALSGLEGVEKVKEAAARGQPFQVAFVDIRMPGIDGVEAIERIWRIDSQVQVVICTAYADYSWEELSRRLGPTDKLLLLKKPFDNIEVTLLASTLVEKWFLGRQAGLKLEQMELLVAQRTRKVLELQRLEPRESHPEPVTPGTAETPAAEPACVLVVAGPGQQSEFGTALGSDYRILYAQDDVQGLQQAREVVPDLIVADVEMPAIDGMELCRRLRRDDLVNHVPVVLLTRDSSESAQIKALEAGADELLTRPLTAPALKNRLENLLRSRGGRDEHFPSGSSLQPRDIASNQVDAKFLGRAVEIIEKHLADFEFDVEALARKMAVSRRQLFRKLKAVTGGTPNGFIRALRLKRAAQLLQKSEMTVTEITYAVGFSDLKHFRAVFREQFGVLPGEYLKQGGAPEHGVQEQGPDGQSRAGKT